MENLHFRRKIKKSFTKAMISAPPAGGEEDGGPKPPPARESPRKKKKIDDFMKKLILGCKTQHLGDFSFRKARKPAPF